MFYDVFQRLCAQYGKAETSVCRELGISAANPKQWRGGIEPKASTKKAIADYFGVPVSMFYENIQETPTYEQKQIPIHVITVEESEILALLSKLTEKERSAVVNLIRELSK